VSEGSGGTREGLGTGGIAARPVPPQRDGSPGMGELPPPWTRQCFVLGDAKKGCSEPWMGVRVVAEAGRWVQGRDWAGMLLLLPEICFPAFLGKKPKSFLLCSWWAQRFPSRGSSVLARTWGWGSPPCPSSPRWGAPARMDPSYPAAVPFPVCHPRLTAWELKISEMQGITGCLNISRL